MHFLSAEMDKIMLVNAILVSLPDAIESDVETDSGSNDEDYENSESKSEEEINKESHWL